MPASGGLAQKLTSDSDQVARGPVAWSPDGKYVAFYSDDGSDSGKVKVIPVAGGPARLLVEGLNGRHDWRGLAWSPNGQELAYTGENTISRVSLDNGKTQQVKTGLDAIYMQIAWSPDGHTIAFSAKQGGEQELWLMEHFLPPARPKR
jgi:Tol biopolymer transport system component